MPLRQLQYLGSLYEGYVTKNRLNKFGNSLIMLPVPKLVVFYNGTREADDETTLRLSDSFDESHRAESDVEVRVRMLNINYGHNHRLTDACRPLYEYSWLIERIRQNKKSLTIESALSLAIDEVPGDFVLKSFLMMNKSEVSTMLLTEYNEAEVMELFKEDGRKEGRDNLLISQVHKKLERGKQPQEIADEVEESLETVNEIIEVIESLGDEDYDDRKVLEAWKQNIK